MIYTRFCDGRIVNCGKLKKSQIAMLLAEHCSFYQRGRKLIKLIKPSEPFDSIELLLRRADGSGNIGDVTIGDSICIVFKTALYLYINEGLRCLTCADQVEKIGNILVVSEIQYRLVCSLREGGRKPERFYHIAKKDGTFGIR